MEVVADADDAATRVLENGVEARQIVQKIVASTLDEIVDFVEHDDVNATGSVHALDQMFEDAIGRPAGEGDRYITTNRQF